MSGSEGHSRQGAACPSCKEGKGQHQALQEELGPVCQAGAAKMGKWQPEALEQKLHSWLLAIPRAEEVGLDST